MLAAGTGAGEGSVRMPESEDVPVWAERPAETKTTMAETRHTDLSMAPPDVE
jgi:hypothetical protein